MPVASTIAGRATAGRGSSPRRPSASRAPAIPPATPAATANTIGLGQQVAAPWQAHRELRPAPLGGEAGGPDGDSARRSECQRPPDQHEGQQLDAQRFAQVEGQARRRLAEHRADEQADEAAQPEEEQRRAERPAAADPDARGDEGPAGRERDQHRLEHEAVLRHAEVELGLERGETDQQAAHQPEPPRRGHVLRAQREAPGRARGVRRYVHARASPPRGAPPARPATAPRRRSASGASAPRA